MSLRPLSILLKSRNLLKGSRHSVSWRLHNQRKNMIKQTNIKVGQKPTIPLERINEMKLPALFNAIDNSVFENDRESIYIITETLVSISNSFIRQYNLDDEAYIGCIELF